MLLAVVFYITLSKDFSVFAQGYVEKYSAHICTLVYANSLSIKETMMNIHVHSVLFARRMMLNSNPE